MGTFLVNTLFDAIFGFVIWRLGKTEGHRQGWARGYDARKYESTPGEFQSERDKVQL